MKARTGRNVTGRTQRKDRKGQAKHEPDFHFGLRKKCEFALFFFRAQRFRFFSRSFFFALSRSFFRFALASAKARKKRRRPPLLFINSCSPLLSGDLLFSYWTECSSASHLSRKTHRTDILRSLGSPPSLPSRIHKGCARQSRRVKE